MMNHDDYLKVMETERDEFADFIEKEIAAMEHIDFKKLADKIISRNRLTAPVGRIISDGRDRSLIVCENNALTNLHIIGFSEIILEKQAYIHGCEIIGISPTGGVTKIHSKTPDECSVSFTVMRNCEIDNEIKVSENLHIPNEDKS